MKKNGYSFTFLIFSLFFAKVENVFADFLNKNDPAPLRASESIVGTYIFFAAIVLLCMLVAALILYYVKYVKGKND